MNFIFLKFFLIVCFSKTIICDSSVIIPLGVMLVNHKIQIFLIILFVWLNLLISIGMEGPLATHVTFPMWTVRGKAISKFRSPNALPRAPTPLGTELVLHLRCVTQLTLVCILRYSGCSSLPIQSSVCYDIQNGSLCRSSFLYATLFQNASLCLSGVLYATLFKMLPFTNLIPYTL